MSEKLNPKYEALMSEAGTIPDRDEAIETMHANMQALQEKINEARHAVDRPGFNASANDIIANRAALSEIEATDGETLRLYMDLWKECGGEDLEEAQKNFDSLNFKSDSSERLQAQLALRDAKDHFYESLKSQLETTETSLGTSVNTVDNKQRFSLGDAVRVRRTSGDIEDGWIIEEITNENDGVVYKVSRPANDGTNGRLVKRIPEGELVKVNSEEGAVAAQATDSGKESNSATGTIANTGGGDKVPEGAFNADEVPEGTFGPAQADTSDQNDEQSTMEKAKELPTKLFLAVKAKLGEMSKSWKELPEKDKKRYKWIGGIAAGALLVAGAYMTMRGFDSGGADQSIGVDSSVGPDVTPSDAGMSATPEQSSEVTDPSVVQESTQATPEPSATVDAAPTTQPSPEPSTTVSSPDTTTPTGAEAAPTTSNLTSAQEKFAESSAKYPWDAAHDIYGDKATDALKEAVDKAQAAGLDVDTFGEGKEWMIRVNGSWDTEDVVKVLAEYMPRQ